MNDFIKALASPDEAERLYAVQDMAETGSIEYVIPLFDQLRIDESQLVRDAIVAGLKRINCSSISDRIFTLFLSPEAYLRNTAVGLFASQKDQSIGYLATQFDHADREVRKLILDALFEIGSPDAMLAIRAYIYDESLNVKITAVEYLGRLGDKDSVSDMIDLFDRELEPMLLATVLESLGNMSAGPAIKHIIETLAPGGDINQAPSLYLPPLLRLTAKVGDREDVIGVLGSVDNIVLYAEDVMNALDEGGRRFPDLAMNRVIQERIITIIQSTEVQHEIRLQAAEKLASLAEKDASMSECGYELGLDLINQPEMMIAGVRLLAASGRPQSTSIIHGVIDCMKDDDLRVLCEDIVSSAVAY